jgi:hypothetical protein
MQSSASRGTPIGAVIAIVGGVLLAVGSFLSWAEVSGGGVSVTAKGTDGSDGYVTLIAGLVAVAAGIAMMRMGRRALAVLAILAGLVGGGLGLYDALTAEDSVLDAAAEEIAPQFGATAEEVRVLLDDAIDAGQLDISIAFGLFIVIGGGALAVVGGVMSLGGGKVPEMAVGAAVVSTPTPAEAPSTMPPAASSEPSPPPPAPPAPPPAP